MVALARIEPFVVTAELRSFRGAARRLGVTPAAVSKAVAALEAQLGVRLLNRSSRHVALTPEGEVFLAHGREALDRIAAAEDLVSQSVEGPRGRLALSMSHVFGKVVVSALDRLLRRHPQLELFLSFSDTAADLLRDELDVALRIGDLPDSSLVARRLRTPSWVTIASPSWLGRHGVPERPSDLAGRTAVRFALPSGRTRQLAFTVPSPELGGVVLDSGDRILDGVVAGLGVGQVFDFMAAEALAAGRVVEVLAAYRTPGPPVHALCLPGRQQVPKVRACLDFLEELLRS